MAIDLRKKSDDVAPEYGQDYGRDDEQSVAPQSPAGQTSTVNVQSGGGGGQSSTGSSPGWVCTSEYLKQNTQIHGWLTFFCFIIALGGFISAIHPIATFDAELYGFAACMSDVSFGLALFVLAIITIVAFCRRDTDAVFLAKTYVVACFVSNILSLAFGDPVGSSSQVMGRLLWGVVWFLYLIFSRQVEEVIPPDYRKTKVRDWYLLGALIVLPFFFFAVGTSDFSGAEQYDTENYAEEEPACCAQDSTAGTFGDGRFHFIVPADFTCTPETVEGGDKVFKLTTSSGNVIATLCSGRDADQSWANFDEYWKAWEYEWADESHSRVVQSQTLYVNGLKYYYRIKRYDLGEYFGYWRFVLLFDSSSDKVCVVSAYDYGSDGYMQSILKSIRF